MKTKINADDYHLIRKISDIQVSVSHVAWVEKITKQDEKGYDSYIYLMKKSDHQIRKFTTGKGDNSPRFSPDGSKIAFLSKRSDESQIFTIALDGGEATKITSLENGVNSLEWSPNGKFIALTSIVDTTWNVKKSDDILENRIYKIKKEDHENKLNDPKVFNRMVYRSGTSFYSEVKFSQIFVVNIDDRSVSQISEGNYNHSTVAWFDAQYVLSVSKREEPVDLTGNAELIKFNIAEKTKGVVVSKFNLEFFSQAPICKKGKIFVPNLHESRKPGQNNHWGMLVGSEIITINKELDRSIGNLKIDGEDVLCLVEENGYANIRSYSISSKSYSDLFKANVSVQAFDGSKTDLYYIGTSSSHPTALYKWDGTESILVHDPNQEWLSKREIIQPEEFWLTNPEGIKYQGWYFDAGQQDSKNPPLILSIHGGPHVMWGNAGSMWHEWQVSLARGYSILAINPIGSTGYGEEFSQLITGRWGIEDARDLMQAFAHFKDKYDESRAYITGGSYAGYQTANIIGRYHNFKAACAQRGVYNLATFWASTDIPIFGLIETTTTPWDNLDLMWDISPISKVPEMKTPLLLIHSENDFRVPISQAEELYGAMKYFDQEVEFVRYPRDGHELSRSGEPDHVVDRLERMLKFFDAH